MLETSSDVLRIVIAASVGIFTIFVCLAIYYVVVILRDFSKLSTSLRLKLELVEKILNLVKDKMEKGSNHMAILADSAIKLVGFIMEKQKNSSQKKKKK